MHVLIVTFFNRILLILHSMSVVSSHFLFSYFLLFFFSDSVLDSFEVMASTHVSLSPGHKNPLDARRQSAGAFPLVQRVNDILGHQ